MQPLAQPTYNVEEAAAFLKVHPLTSGQQAAKELDELLAPKTAQKPKHYLSN